MSAHIVATASRAAEALRISYRTTRIRMDRTRFTTARTHRRSHTRMPIPQAKKLLEEAGTRKLTTKERRHVIAYLMATDPEKSDDTAGLAELFNCSDSLIRLDKRKIREELAKEIRSVDPALILTDVMMELDRALADIERSKNKAPLGSVSRLKHDIAKVKLRNEVFQMLQSVGYLPKQLGNISVEKFEYKTVIGNAGEIVSGRKVDTYDYLMKPGALPPGKESEVQEAEFEEVSASPPIDGEQGQD